MRAISLRGARALVTGAASGIGRALAGELAAAGCAVFAVDQDEAGLADLVQRRSSAGAEIASLAVDLSQPDAIDEIVAAARRRFGGALDLLVNNAGVLWHGPTHVMTREECDRLIEVDLRAPIRLTLALLPDLLARPRAHVLNVSSLYGLVARPYAAAYHAAKFGLVGFTLSLRAEYATRNLGATLVCPGYVKTKLFENAGSGRPGKPAPTPPEWTQNDATSVAKAAIAGMLRNRRLVTTSWTAAAMIAVHDTAPWLVEWLNRSRLWRRLTDPHGDDGSG